MTGSTIEEFSKISEPNLERAIIIDTNEVFELPTKIELLEIPTS